MWQFRKSNFTNFKMIFGDKKLLSRMFKKEMSLDMTKKPLLSTHKKHILPYHNIPGPSGIPLLGCTHHFMPGGKFFNVTMNDMLRKLNNEYGDIVKLSGLPGKRDMIFIFNEDDTEMVYRSDGALPYRPGMETMNHFRKELRPDIYGDMLGVGFSQGKDWLKLRMKVNPFMMHPLTHRQYTGAMDETSREFIQRIRQILDKNGVTPDNFNEELNKWSVESMCKIALDKKLGLLKGDLKEDSPAKLIMTHMSEFLKLTFDLDFKPSLWRYISTPKYLKLMKGLDILTTSAVGYVDEAYKEHEKNCEENKDLQAKSVLQKLCQIDKKLAYITAIDMLIAGVDTTALTTAIALYNLSTNPDRQDLLHKEITNLLPNKDDPIMYEDITKMPYLRATLKESSRITPVGIGNYRRVQQDIVLSGYSIPEGTDILLAHSIQSNKCSNFPNPERFLPERWLRTSQDKGGCPIDPTTGELIPRARDAHPFAHLPFGFGPRVCLGKRFAELEMQCLIINILRNFKVEWTRGELQFNSKILNEPVGPLKFKFIDV